jgi:hypothetical protein
MLFSKAKFYTSFHTEKNVVVCWALIPQGQGLWHWIQLLEVLPY